MSRTCHVHVTRFCTCHVHVTYMSQAVCHLAFVHVTYMSRTCHVHVTYMSHELRDIRITPLWLGPSCRSSPALGARSERTTTAAPRTASHGFATVERGGGSSRTPHPTCTLSSDTEDPHQPCSIRAGSFRRPNGSELRSSPTVRHACCHLHHPWCRSSPMEKAM